MSFLKKTIDNHRALPVAKQTLIDATVLKTIDTGVLLVMPAEESVSAHKLVISSGIHGNETAPMEIVDGLISSIYDGQLTVRTPVLFIIGNPLAAKEQVRFVDDNLNRLFDGQHRNYNSPEAARAKLLEEVVSDFYSTDTFSKDTFTKDTYSADTFSKGLGPTGMRLHYDLHTAIRGSELEKFAVYPYLNDRTWNKSQIGFLEQCGIEGVLLSNQPAGTFSYFTSHRFGAHSFTIELGKVRKFGENDMRKFDAMDQGLRRIISGEEVFNNALRSIKLFSVVEEVIKRSDALQLHIADDAKNFTEYPVNSLLASDVDYEYRTQVDGERFVFPIKNVPCGQRAMLVVAPTRLD